MLGDAWKQIERTLGEIYFSILLTSAHYPEIFGERN